MPRAIPTYIKRIKYNFIVTDISGTPTGGVFEAGAYIKVDQFYAELFKADITNILHEINGDRKILAYDDMDIDTPAINPQLLTSQDKQKISFYKEPLVEGTDCYIKAKKYLGFNGTAIDTNDSLAVDINDKIAFEY